MSEQTERSSAVLASYVILRRGYEVLLLQRQHTGYEDGNLSLPTGHVKPGEAAADAAIREAGEEVGIEIARRDVHCVHVMQRLLDHDRVEFFFEVRDWEGEPQNCEPEKCDDVGWFSLGDLPENTIPYIRTALEACLQGLPYSEYHADGFDKVD